MSQRKPTTSMLGNKRLCAALALLVTLLCAAPLRAEIETTDLPETDADSQTAAVATHSYASAESGYRFITPDGPLAAASPYGRLTSGVTGGFSAGTLGSDLKLTVDGNFLHEDDYHTELFFDYAGQVRFHAESGALWHNLLREQVNTGTVPALTPRTLDQDVTYGVRTGISQADTRIKLGNNPIHLNLGYGELKREGYGQLRFSDYYFGPDASSVITEANRVDQTTRAGKIGLDAHLRLFDVSYDFLIRDFSNDTADPRYTFTNNALGALIPGSQAHDVIPDNRVTSHTIKLYTNLSGGLVGSASYNLTQRENNGGHGDAIPSSRPSDAIHSVAGDVSYTPSRQYSFALKYRHREIDRSTPATLYYPYSQVPPFSSTPGDLSVRPATSSIRDILTFSATFRPLPQVIYRLEYNAEREERDNIPDALAPAGTSPALRSDSRLTHTGTATFYWKPARGAKVNATYIYASSDNPAYASSFSDQHTGKLLITYTTNTRWGLSANYIARQESVDNSSAQVSKLPRNSRSDSASAALWFSPAERLTLTTTYSFLQTDTDQTVLFTNLSLGTLAASNYRALAHVYGLDAVYALSDDLDLSASLQQVRSFSRFQVPPLADAAYSSAGITGLTNLDSSETGVSARADWRFTRVLGCGLEYRFRRYDSGQPLFDGSVHSTMVSLKARW